MTMQQRRSIITRAARCESLEPRWMLATFVGTEGDDDISITVLDGETRVFINSVFQTSTAFSVSILALGGNDTVVISRTQGDFRVIGVELGDGNDRFTVRASNSANLDYGTFVEGGAGNDTIEVEGTTETLARRRIGLNATSGGNPAQPAVVLFNSNLTTPRFTYDSSVENCAITGTPFNDEIFLTEKRETLSVSVAGMDGDDSVHLGGDDLDSNGWLGSNLTLAGGNGADELFLNDELDKSDDGPASTYVFNNQSVTRGTTTINYNGFESQTINAANGVTSGLQPIPVLTFNAVSGMPTAATTIVGGLNRGCIVNFDDSAAGGIVNSYQVTETFFRPSGPQTINYSRVTQMTLSASTVPDSVSINSTPAGMSLTVLGNGGNDSINFGGDIGADIGGPVSISGGPGTDSLIITNVLDNAPSNQMLTSSTFVDVNTHSYASIESLAVNQGPGAVTLAVNSVNIATTINGGSGDDVITVGNGNLNLNLLANVNINGAGGNDQLNVLDQSAGTGRTHAFTPTSYQFGNTGRTITFTAIEGASLRSGAGNDSVDVVASNIPISVHTGGEVPIVGGFPAGDNLKAGSFGPATVIIDQTDTVLNLSVGGLLHIPNGVVLNRVAPLVDLGLNLGGVIDVAGALLWRGGGNTPDFRTFLSRGRAGGAWNGTNASGAIHSSAAGVSAVTDGVGYGLGSEIGISSIGGFTINPGDTLLRYTLEGDADLNAAVNLDDFTRLAAGFGQPGAVWTRGDFSYDNSVNLDDFTPLAGNFGTVQSDFYSQRKALAVDTAGVWLSLNNWGYTAKQERRDEQMTTDVRSSLFSSEPILGRVPRVV